MKKMNTRIARWILIPFILTSCTSAAGLNNSEIEQPAVTVTAEENSFPPSAAGQNETSPEAAWSTDPYPLQIEVMREQTYTSSPITIEQTLDPGVNYNRYVVSYLSEGFKIYALMTVPFGNPPDTGWPVIIFNHGYINPPDYRTTENYVSYMDMIARNGYIVFKSDYRGHGYSEGPIVGGGYGSPGYTADVLNAMESLKNYEGVDPNRFGMWGHSMGGQVTLRAMVVSDEIKAGVIWAGAIAPYAEIISQWNFAGQRRESDDFLSNILPDRDESNSTVQGWGQSFGGWVEEFTTIYGTFDQNPEFWETISPNSYLADLSGPIQIHHGTADWMVPLEWSEGFIQKMEDANMPYEFYTYEGDDHNISGNYREAMLRTVAFFDQYVKGN
jgi:dipeptidyl aminopeptidase/acylaminoacyl peptidase